MIRRRAALVIGLVGLNAAAAAAPVAVIEEIAGSPTGIELMDYVEPGKVLVLGPQDAIVVGYIGSCWRETIKGGPATVRIGTQESDVQGGAVDRVKVGCDGGRMELAAAQSKQSAAMVFRKVPGANAAPKPQFRIHGLSPVVELKGGGTLVIERVDEAGGERFEVTLAPRDLTRGAFYDFAKAGRTLKAGAVYRARVADQQVVFDVDPAAREGATPVAGRLIRFQPAP